MSLLSRWPARAALVVTLTLAGITASHAQETPETMDPRTPNILPIEKRSEIIDIWLKERLDTLVGPLMRREGVAMWILTAGEYDEDPVAKTMLPSTWLSARRTTILVFYDRGGDAGIERFAIARYPVADLFPSYWNPEEHGDQWKRLADLVAERNPENIAINVSEDFPLADGISAGMKRKLIRALGPMADRLVEKEELAIGWLETRTPAEMASYSHIVRIAHSIIAEAFSEKVITPGVTTTDDVRWFLRQRVLDLGLATWFHPSVNVQRPEQSSFELGRMNIDAGNVIMPGDFLNLDFGITYLRLNTDTQHHAYVLKPGETEVPKGLRDGLAAANKVQDAVKAEMKAGRSGNDVLMAARKTIEKQKIDGTIYSHPIGFHGHGAGPWIGAWEDQSPLPDGRGTKKIHPNTAWSIELSARKAVPEWGGQVVRFMTEEDAYFDGKTVRYLDGRQKVITPIPRP